jgi:hypothetical protein
VRLSKEQEQMLEKRRDDYIQGKTTMLTSKQFHARIKKHLEKKKEKRLK